MQIPVIVSIAVLAFWLLGAHNRLTRLRNRHQNAFGPLSSALRQRHAVALTLAEAARTLRGADRGQIEEVLAAAHQAAAASDSATLRVQAATLQRVANAEEVLGESLDELVHALHDLSYGEAPQPAISELLRQRHALQSQIVFAGQIYNDHAREYNDALCLFPTTLAARILHFKPAPAFLLINAAPPLVITGSARVVLPIASENKDLAPPPGADGSQ
jgi:LemA protein